MGIAITFLMQWTEDKFFDSDSGLKMNAPLFANLEPPKSKTETKCYDDDVEGEADVEASFSQEPSRNNRIHSACNRSS